MTAACVLAGCRHPGLAAREAQARQDSLTTTAQIWSRSEQGRPERVRRMSRHVGWYFAHQAECFERNVQGAERYIDRDLERFAPRMQRAGKRAAELLYGKPERIEENAIILFF